MPNQIPQERAADVRLMVVRPTGPMDGSSITGIRNQMLHELSTETWGGITLDGTAVTRIEGVGLGFLAELRALSVERLGRPAQVQGFTGMPRTWRTAMKSTMRVYALMMLASFGASAGRSLSSPYPDRALFTIHPAMPEHASTQGDDSQEKPDVVLRVRRIISVPPYGGTAFIYRTGPQQLKTDYYSSFAAARAELITAELVRWLRQTHQFEAVVDGNSGIPAPWVLEGRLQELVVDTTDPDKPEAVLMVQSELLDDREAAARVLLEQTYSMRVKMKGKDGRAAAAGWSAACGQLFAQVSADLKPRATSFSGQ